MKTDTETNCSVWLITANDLRIGNVVYRTHDDSWSKEIGLARQFTNEPDANKALENAVAETAIVVGAYLVAAQRLSNGQLALCSLRDRFRDQGPTHRADLAKSKAIRNGIES